MSFRRGAGWAFAVRWCQSDSVEPHLLGLQMPEIRYAYGCGISGSVANNYSFLKALETRGLLLHCVHTASHCVHIWQ